MLSERGNPELRSLDALLHALGVSFARGRQSITMYPKVMGESTLDDPSWSLYLFRWTVPCREACARQDPTPQECLNQLFRKYQKQYPTLYIQESVCHTPGMMIGQAAELESGLGEPRDL